MQSEDYQLKAKKLIKSKLNIKDSDIIKVKYLVDGYTNNSFLFVLKDSNKYVVRIGSYEAALNRKNEKQIIDLILNKCGAEILYFDENNGNMIKKYFEGHTPTDVDCHNKSFLSLLAKKIIEFHEIKIDNAINIPVNEYYAYKDIKLPIDKKYSDLYFSLLEKYKHLELTLSHNDLSPWNIIYNEKTNEIKFIDYEYIRLNYIYFDIATFIHQSGIYKKEICEYFIDQFNGLIDKKILNDFLYISAMFTYQWTFSIGLYKDASGFRNEAWDLMQRMYKKVI